MAQVVTMTVLVSSLGTLAQGSEGARSHWHAANQDALERRQLRSDLAPGEAAACGLLDATVQIFSNGVGQAPQPQTWDETSRQTGRPFDSVRHRAVRCSHNQGASALGPV
jgi:hypothetical protein